MSLEKLKWATIISFVVSMVSFRVEDYLAKGRVPLYPGKVVEPDGRALLQK